jgi:hypothetical protein
MSRRSPSPFTLGLEFSLEQPLDFEDARDAARKFAEQRQEARQMLESAYAEQAQAEFDYRKARREQRMKATDDTGKERDEFVDAATAEHRKARDLALYKVKIINERLEEIDASRASLHRLIEWSAAIDPAAEHDRSEQKRDHAGAMRELERRAT